VIIKLQTAMVLLNKGELHIQVCRSARHQEILYKRLLMIYCW